MSAPSTASYHPHHHHYSHHQQYHRGQSPPSYGYHHHLAPAVSQQQQQQSQSQHQQQQQQHLHSSQQQAQNARQSLQSRDHLPSPNSTAHSHQTPTMASSASYSSRGPSNSVKRRRRGTPDWNDFYKNGLPKEVIVIDDTPPPPEKPASSRYQAQPSNYTSRVPRPISGASMATTSQPAKKRKTAANGVDKEEAYHDLYTSTPYSVTQTPAINGIGSSANTARTTSSRGLNGTETAPTSLGSTVGETASHAGTKRKRVTRGAAAKAETDAFANYKPPPRPPVKAKEVYVKTVVDSTSPKTNVKVDDDDGHYIVVPDTDLTSRYRIQKLLGQGTFGKVVQAYDKQLKTYCAIKIIRSVQKYRDASRIELRVLSTLNSNDKKNRNKCIHLRDCFDYKNHICIVTDLLGMSVFDFLKANQFVPFPSSQIQEFARQLLTSVAFLHDLNLIHTDLKPENILLVHNASEVFSYNRTIPSSSTTNPRRASTRRVLLDTDIRLIDFGSATFDDEYHSSVVSTRHYRAPEIILGLGWSFPCDIWSIGCILVEFFTGDALFQTHENIEHLAMMRTVCGGDIETKLVRQAIQKSQGQNNPASRFFKGYKLDYPNTETSRTSRRYVRAMKPLTDIIPQTSTFNRQFLDLLRRIFVYDPAKRITAREALMHPWFNESTRDEGTQAQEIRKERAHDLEKRRKRRINGGTSDTEEEEYLDREDNEYDDGA